jgi:hypothetical protein
MNPKAAKDLLYVRDVMAAGRVVVGRIAEDVRRIRRGSKRERNYVDESASRLNDLLRFGAGERLEEVARMFVERDGADIAIARADVMGHLTDCIELFRDT